MSKAYWSYIIKSRTGWFDIPVAQLWHFRDLIFIFVKRDFTSVYKQTILGPLWHFIQPLFSSFIFAFAFAFVAKISTGPVPPVLFYLSGIVPWYYFADCTNRTSATFRANAGIFGKVYFPRLVIPLSVVLSNLIKFVIQLFLFITIYIFFHFAGHKNIYPNIYIFLMPVLLLIMAFLGLGVGLIVSSLTIRYRDLANLVGFGVQLLMYLSTVIFPVTIWPARVHWIIYANPMTAIIETFRLGFLGIGAFEGMHLLYSFFASLLLFLAGILIFNRTEQNFIDTV